MNNFLIVSILLVMAGVVFVLAKGIGSFGRGTAESARQSNRMMWWRIGLQAVALVLIFVFYFFAKNA